MALTGIEPTGRVADVENTPRAAAWWCDLQARRMLVRSGIVLLILLYVCLWGASALFPINPTDFDVFFLPSAKLAAAGHPFEIYRIRYQDVYPNANGPLSSVPLALVAALAGRLGWLDDPTLRRVLAMAVFSVFALLLSREVLLACDRLLPRPLRGWRRLIVYVPVALSPELWHSMLLYGHVEQPLMLWLVLWAVRSLAEQRAWRAGVLLGLALLTRSAAVLYALPLALLLARGMRWRQLGALLASCGGVVVAGLLPFWLADRADLLYSLVTFRAELPIGGGTAWRLAVGTPWQSFAENHDTLVILAGALLVCIALLALRRDLDVSSREVYALLAVSGLCFPLLIKTLWPYYFLDAYMLLAICWLSGVPGGRSIGVWLRWWPGLLALVAAVGLGQVAEAEVERWNSGLWDVQWSLAMAGLIAGLLVAIALWVWWRGGGGGRRQPAARRRRAEAVPALG